MSIENTRHPKPGYLMLAVGCGLRGLAITSLLMAIRTEDDIALLEDIFLVDRFAATSAPPG